MSTAVKTLWPVPQELRWREDVLALSRAALVVPAQAKEELVGVARLFADMVMDEFGLAAPVARGETPEGKIPIRLRIAGQRGSGRTARDLPGEEGYLLRVTAEGGELVGRDARGAQHGVATLVQLAERRGEEVVVRGVEVRDWPYKPVRMAHLYLPGVDHLGYARRYLREALVRYKFNGLFVELGGGVRLPNRPEIALGWRRFVEELRAIGDTVPIYGEHTPLGPKRRFAASVHTHLADGGYIEPDDLTRLAEWARGLNLDLVPEVQSLAHAYYLACAHPEIAELAEADFPDTYCPCNPRSYEILFDVMSAYIELTKCGSVHIGHDEWRAAGLCPKCRGRDTGELFGEDVVKISSWLGERGLGVWMWGDHLVPKHNARRRSHDSGKVWYDHPDTEAAARIIAEGAPGITMLNWSWWLGREDSDRVLADLGFKQIYGNFGYYQLDRFEDWEGRSAEASVLGAEVSSWCAWNDYELGLAHYPQMPHVANMLWSNRPPRGAADHAAAARELTKLRDRMRRGWEEPRLWSVAAAGERKHVISIREACNAPLRGEGWDLTGLRSGRGEHAGVPYEVVEPAEDKEPAAVVVERLHKPEAEYPHSAGAIAVGGKYASLI
ncbi:MAG: family 20 glycosylhydrolase, partial [Armatimonadota bacterium]